MLSWEWYHISRANRPTVGYGIIYYVTGLTIWLHNALWILFMAFAYCYLITYLRVFWLLRQCVNLCVLNVQYLGVQTNAAVYEVDDRYRRFGFEIDDTIEKCRVLRHHALGTRSFVGCVFTSAPVGHPLLNDLVHGRNRRPTSNWLNNESTSYQTSHVKALF